MLRVTCYVLRVTCYVLRVTRFLFHRDKRRNITLIRTLMDAQVAITEPVVENAQQIMLRLTGFDIHCCPHCSKGQMIVILKIPKGSILRDSPP